MPMRLSYVNLSLQTQRVGLDQPMDGGFNVTGTWPLIRQRE
jgi:hypothetical protein